MKQNFLLWMIPAALTAGLILLGFRPADDGGEQHPEVDYSVSCMECHQEITPQIFEEWQKSAHGEMNFGCYLCHGDGVESFTVSPGVDRCISCHSNHEACTTNPKTQACFACHQGHSLKIKNKKEN